jgi:hypothetical protein
MLRSIDIKSKVDIKSAIGGIFQDITIEDDFDYMKEIMPKPIITMEVFKNKSSKVKEVKTIINNH